MQKQSTDILIIGAGLTGLTLAYYLKQLNVSVTIVEARSRLGGRVYTKENTNQAPIELGATWLVNEHSELLGLLKTLNLEVFEQFYGTTAIYEPSKAHPPQLVNSPNNNQTSYRIKNGTQTIINALSTQLEENQIITDCAISSIKRYHDFISATSEAYEFKCKHIISTLPPYLFDKTITIEPELPREIKEIMQNTHTWMQDSIKVGFTFEAPFWKGERTSGTIYSTVSVLQEFYDHSSSDNTSHALVGFMNKEFHSHTKEERQELALEQLEQYYGNQVRRFLSYEELDWRNERFTTASHDGFLMSQQNNGHPLFQNSFLNNSLFVAGTETSPYASGKMEGAIRSARHIFKHIESLL
ncbi:MAG: monoamine oxidase [Psychroserpens sp.]|jgi:monoamine oxidase|uniref:flavin monoamine oxidase family protein n=1 Tax=Psychroserpens sp. TaxID=2020870 RepID=UPI0039E6E14E